MPTTQAVLAHEARPGYLARKPDPETLLTAIERRTGLKLELRCDDSGFSVWHDEAPFDLVAEGVSALSAVEAAGEAL